MGASNALAAYLEWSHLANRPLRVLVWLSLSTIDKDNPPRYWGGRELIATNALGYTLPDESETGEEVEMARKRAFLAVGQMIAALVKEGALVRLRPGGFRRHAEYALILSDHHRQSADRILAGEDVIRASQGIAEQPPQGIAEQPPQGIAEQSTGHHSAIHWSSLSNTPMSTGEQKRTERNTARKKNPPSLNSLAAHDGGFEEELQRQSVALQKRIADFNLEAS